MTFIASIAFTFGLIGLLAAAAVPIAEEAATGSKFMAVAQFILMMIATTLLLAVFTRFIP